MAAAKKPGIDKDLIRELAELLKETELSEIEIEQDNFRIRISRNAPAAPTHVTYAEPPRPAEAPPAAAPAQGESAKSLADPARHPGCVPSPMVGTVFRAPDPKAKPFVEVGDAVAAGQTILIVEAMKHMNEVAAPRAGRVVEILVEDGQPVEYGQPLMIIE
jgi:acetyl-CoA carboxylase biotin carboxyl carrier protein